MGPHMLCFLSPFHFVLCSLLWLYTSTMSQLHSPVIPEGLGAPRMVNAAVDAPLTEKYRPRKLDDISGNREVMRCLKSFTMENMPNMLFYGPPGTGKTTAIRALLRDYPAQNVLELNASDERGIDTVRDQIKSFASVRSDGIRMVVLDEADSMSKEAQSALRRIMEDFSSTRFCLICNYSRKIIDPIASRCTRFRFAPVTDRLRIESICRTEGIPYDEEGIAAIEEYSDGDMRKVMNDIQGVRSSYDVVNRRNVLELFGLADESLFNEIFGLLLTGTFDLCVKQINQNDMDCLGLLRVLTPLVIQSNMNRKMSICKALAEIEDRLGSGCSDQVQMRAIVATFILNRG